MRAGAHERFIILSIACLAVGLSASGQELGSSATTGEHHGIDVSGMDRSVQVRSPADLYRFANGAWLDHTSIPPDHTEISRLFEIYAGGAEPSLIDGLTGDQRFCIAYAQTWRTLDRPEQAKVKLATDWHSPPAVRAQGALSDLPEFYKAFGLPVPDNLPHIW